jgi:hypothetical protein
MVQNTDDHYPTLATFMNDAVTAIGQATGWRCNAWKQWRRFRIIGQPRKRREESLHVVGRYCLTKIVDAESVDFIKIITRFLRQDDINHAQPGLPPSLRLGPRLRRD